MTHHQEQGQALYRPAREAGSCADLCYLSHSRVIYRKMLREEDKGEDAERKGKRTLSAHSPVHHCGHVVPLGRAQFTGFLITAMDHRAKEICTSKQKPVLDCILKHTKMDHWFVWVFLSVS
jgi:hypothetical protein